MSEAQKPVPPPYTAYPTDAYPPAGPPGYGPYAAPPPYGMAVPGPEVHTQAPTYGATVVQMPAQVVILNGCPACGHGVLEDEYSCLGIFCAIFFFPLGLLCCLLTRERRCTNCRVVF